MKEFLKKLIRILGYAAAALVILLAVAVGLFRLFLPKLPEYQEEIKIWASDAISMEVEFSGMNARWGLSGPELEFFDAELIRPDNRKRAIAAEVVRIGISLNSLLFDQNLVVDRVEIRDTSVEVRQLENGGWWVQGTAIDELPATQPGGSQRLGDMRVVGENIEIRFLQPGDERPRFIRVPRALVSINENRIAFDATVRLSDDLGKQVTVSATQLLGMPLEDRSWDVSLEADSLALSGWSQLQLDERFRILSGNGDLDLSLVLAGSTVRHATADVDFADVSLIEGQAFDLNGRFELDTSSDGWLVAAEELQLTTSNHEWPESSLRAEAGTDADGNIAMLNVRASYLNLDDSSLLLPLLPEAGQNQLNSLAPSGEIEELAATVSDIDSDKPQFDVTAELIDVGIAAEGKRPGIRGFTGLVRANRSGGRVEIVSSDLLFDLPQIMDEPIDILTAEGTVLWRSSDTETIVLSDSIRIINPVLDSRSNVRLTIDRDGGAPDIDLATTFSISDVGEARRYVPRKVMKERLFNWFQSALEKGSIENGKLALNGPLDKFPFENGEGLFRIDASARNLTMRYEPQWPAAEQADIDMVLENTRLYSVRNRSTNAGNQAVNTRVEIPNLRKPVLKIDGLVTGSLETLRQFALQSPINDFTGGNLSRLTLSGDASFNLDLTVPLKDATGTTLTGLLRSNNGTLAIEGLDPPITDLIGEVLITRDTISGDSLGGRFLGEEVGLQVGPADSPQFFAVATAQGSATGTAIIEAFGVPLEGFIEGKMDYTARVLFPRGSQETPPPLTVQIESDLVGLAIEAPDPVHKLAEDVWPVRGDIRFMPGGESIESTGSVGDRMSWQLALNQPEGEWDLDRGVLMLGGGEVQLAETRGLHIRGTATVVRLDEWLNLSRSEDKKIGTAERIRSIDLTVDNLFAIGQHLKGHHVRLDRSALDWLVQVEGEDIVGSVSVPYDFGSERAMVVDMERMRLPGDDVSPPSVSDLDPRKLPPIMLTADEFALGDRYLGAVEANLVRTENGLETETLVAKDASFEIVGSGQWVADENEELGSRTYVTATLNSVDVRSTLARLDFAQGISGQSMGILMDTSWSGGPRASFLDVLDGDVQVRMEEGQLEEVEPGAGRMLGLISFVALPRRLSLDFRDVFNKGFRYDTIAGTFNIVDGIAMTCDLSLEGPAADIGIVGRVDFEASEYEQGAVISAKVGNTLPIVGAVVGGPPGAAVMLIFSQIFKKPLQSVGQVYYGISGPWEEPAIESVDADDFVRYGELAGCLAEGERQ